MPVNLTLIASLISAAVAGAAGFGLAWRLQTATINQMELGNANQRISLQRAARQTIERQQNAVVAAQDAAAQRRRDLDVVRRSSDAAIGGLRDPSAAALRAAGESLDACTRIIKTYDLVFTESASLNAKVAGDADQCFSDQQTLIDAWPK